MAHSVTEFFSVYLGNRKCTSSANKVLFQFIKKLSSSCDLVQVFTEKLYFVYFRTKNKFMKL